MEHDRGQDKNDEKIQPISSDASMKFAVSVADERAELGRLGWTGLLLSLPIL